MRIQAEVFLLDNTIMNGLMLLMAAALARCRLRNWKTVLFLCMMAAGYALAAVSLRHWLLSPVCKLLVGTLLATGLRTKGLKEYLKALTCLLFSAMVSGGALLLLLGSRVHMQQGMLLGSVSVRAALFLALFAACLPRLIRAFMNRMLFHAPGNYAALRITTGQEQRIYRVLVDTGNRVIEPVSGLPVVLLKNVQPSQKNAWPVPYHTVGGQGILYAALPGKAEVLTKTGWQELCIMVAGAPDHLEAGIGGIIGSCALLGIETCDKGGRHGLQTDMDETAAGALQPKKHCKKWLVLCAFRRDAAAALRQGRRTHVDRKTGRTG